MLTVEEFRKMVFESLDLSVLSTIAREIPSVRSELYTELEVARAILSDNGPPVNALLSTTNSTKESSPKVTILPPPVPAANATGSAAFLPPRQVVNHSVFGSPSLSSTASASSSVSSKSPSPSASPPVPMRATESPTTTRQPAAANPSTTTTASTATTAAPQQPFVWGDFGSMENVSDYGSSSSSSRGGLSSSPSRRSVSHSAGGSSHAAHAEEALASFGDFSFFVPVAKVDPVEKNKLESSFNRSMSRRSSVTVHKVLDELEEHDEDEEDKHSAGTFSFGDFNVGSPLEHDDRPHSSFRAAPSDAAFMFGDFMVELPEDKPNKPKVPPASSSTATNSKTAAFSKPLTSRVVKRPLITHGALFRSVNCRHYTGHKSRVRGVVLAVPTENCVISSGGDVGCNMRSSGTTQMLSLYVGHTEMVLHVAISPDLLLLASSGSDGLLCVFEISTGKRAADCAHNAPVLCSSFSKNGKYLVSGSQDGICRLWASKKKGQSTPMTSYFGHKALVTCVMFQPNGEMVASGSGDAVVHLWSASTAKALHVWPKLHSSAVMSLGFTGTGAHLLSCDMQRVALSDCTTGVALWSIDAPAFRPSVYKFFFTGASFAPQQAFPNYVFICGSDSTVSLFEFLIVPRDPSKTLAPKPPKKGEKTAVQTQPEVTASLSPELWSTVARSKVCVMNAGPKHSMAMGDINGNVMVVTLLPRAGETVPVPSKVRSPKATTAPSFS